MWWYSESFVFLLAGTGMGCVMACLSAIGCFLLALFNKDEAVGEVRIGKVFNVKGVSLIMLGVCGVFLMIVCVYTWGKMHLGSDDDPATLEDYDWGYELGYLETEGPGAPMDFDDPVVAPESMEVMASEGMAAPPEPEGVVALEPYPMHYADPPLDIGEELGPDDDGTRDLGALLEEMEALEYAEEDWGD